MNRSNPKEELKKKIENSYLIRKVELKNYLLKIESIDIESELKETFEKSFVLLLYAHWEGYIKEVTNDYIRYVCSQNKTMGELTSNFTDIFIKYYLQDYEKHKNIQKEKEITTFISKINGRKFKIPFDSFYEKFILGIESNLNTAKFKNICALINYDFIDNFVLIEINIDKLVHNRNNIAHTGIKAFENTYINIDDLNKIFDIVFGEMLKIKNHLLASIDEKKYFK